MTTCTLSFSLLLLVSLMMSNSGFQQTSRRTAFVSTAVHHALVRVMETSTESESKLLDWSWKRKAGRALATPKTQGLARGDAAICHTPFCLIPVISFALLCVLVAHSGHCRPHNDGLSCQTRLSLLPFTKRKDASFALWPEAHHL